MLLATIHLEIKINLTKIQVKDIEYNISYKQSLCFILNHLRIAADVIID